MDGIETRGRLRVAPDLARVAQDSEAFGTVVRRAASRSPSRTPQSRPASLDRAVLPARQSRPVMLVKTLHANWYAGYKARLEEGLPDLDIHEWQDRSVDDGRVHYAFIWQPEPGRLKQFPNLKAILSASAGTDHIVRGDPEWPRHVPIVPMGDPELAERMANFVHKSVLNMQFHTRAASLAQAEHRWARLPSPLLNRDLRIGIMGMGRLGEAAARQLATAGYQVSGWSRSGKSIPQVTSFAGDAERDDFLHGTDILVCLLPSTPQTDGMLNAETLGKLPDNAGVVNVGRGSHVVMQDLVAALDSGRLSEAALDVFEIEPLPVDSAVWDHPNITVTPHVGAISSEKSRSDYVIGTVRAIEQGDAPPSVYDPARGY